MKALLVNPFLYDFAAFDFWAKPRGLLEVGGLLQQIGYDVELIDCLYTQDEGMAEFARSHADIEPPKPRRFGTGSYFREGISKPDVACQFPRRFYRYGFSPDYLRQRLAQISPRPTVIGVTGIMTYWYQGVRETIGIIKEIFPDVPVILGGIYATLLPEHARAVAGADAVFTGRASRESLREFLGARTIPLPVAVRATEAAPVFFPYTKPSYGVTALSEGCRSRCSYCACWQLYPDWRARALDHALAEVDQAAALGCRDFAFYDDDLLLDFDRTLQPFLRAVQTRHPGLRWHTPNGLYMTRLNLERCRLLREHGFETLRFGFETADENLSQRIGHKIARRQFAAQIEALFQAGFRAEQIGVYLMIGLPGQTPAQVEDSIRFVQQCGVKPNLTEFSPVPGTPEFARARAEMKVNFVTEPLLQNNSLLPLRNPVFDLATVNQLKNLSTDGSSPPNAAWSISSFP